ncbi:MAG: nitrate- and nitrite sensing domain-containing protein [Anaerolineales bacterium]|nr:nitrate- and nitrite sensing domain-containing protein [Anaerolineales bacterium]MCB9430795.1 nitrate- and nitrite sensing domain-containing protein [Ardenticatenaceae bacterium]
MISLKNIKLSHKHLLLVLMPLLALLYFVTVEAINRAQLASEMADIQNLVNFSVALSDYVDELQKERAQTALFLGSGGQQFQQQMLTQRKASDASKATLLELFADFDAAQFGPEFEGLATGAINNLSQLPAIHNQIDTLSVTSANAINSYSTITSQLLNVVAFSARLSSDGEISRLLTTYNLFLQIKELAGQERAILADVFAADRVKPSELGRFVTVAGGQAALETAFLNASRPDEIDFYTQTVQGKEVDNFLRLREVAINNSAIGNFGVAPDLWFQTASVRIDRLGDVEFQLAAKLIATASNIQSRAQTSLILFIALVLVALIITGGVVYLVSHQITQSIDAINQTFIEVGEGQLENRVADLGDDELGQMAQGLNSMLDNTLTLIETREDRNRIEAAIMKLIDEVAGVAEGDLTVEAEVTTDMTGAIADSFNFMIGQLAIADSFNFMIGQLRQIITAVQETSLHVSSSANEIQTTAEHLAYGSESQAAQIIDTSAAIDEMTVSIQQVSENASLSATVGEQASVNAQRGTRAVQNTIAGMNRIRAQVQETARRIEQLGESSRQINEFVKLISGISNRTSILALNASIQAARAGVSGSGFAVVAEEVERLAERSTEATRQIVALTRSIQQETHAAVTSMSLAIREVDNGASLANEAGGTLREIEDVSNQLSGLIQSISLAAKQQARGSEAIALAMSDIADVTQQTAAGTKQAAVSINNLAQLANELRSSVSTFRLPNGSGRGVNGR